MAIAILLIWYILMALATGSFLGVVICRLPSGEPIMAGRSECPHCHTVLGALELIPVASFALQKGRCRTCRAVIPGFHLWVELVALGIALVALAAAHYLPLPGGPKALAELCLLGAFLMPLAWIDADHFWLPDALTLPGILAGLAMCWWITPAELGGHAAGAAVGFLSLAAIGAIYKRLRGREGLGLGDAKLLALAGAWTGWQHLASIMLGAAVLGILVTLILRRRGSLEQKIPLGTYMAPFIFLAAMGLLP